MEVRRYLSEVIAFHSGVAVADETPIILGPIVRLYQVIYFRIRSDIGRTDNESAIDMGKAFLKLCDQRENRIFAVCDRKNDFKFRVGKLKEGQKILFNPRFQPFHGL